MAKKKRKVINKNKNIKKKKRNLKKKNHSINSKNKSNNTTKKTNNNSKKLDNKIETKNNIKLNNKKTNYKKFIYLIFIILFIILVLSLIISNKRNNINNNKSFVLKDNFINTLDMVTSLQINNERKIYLPLKGKFKIEAKYDVVGNFNEKVKYYSENNNIADVKEDGTIVGLKKGSTKVHAIIGNKDEFVDVLVTDLITVRPSKGYDYKKKYLGCNKYSKNDNDLIDEILKNRIESVGYKTRAGVVEAARFLTLDFPYRINYFYENGRQTTNNVDGEGRYYHIGFYLHSSRYKNITGSQKGPKAWGCSLYSRPAHRNINNGLDCSGFVSWALLNGGFNVKDVGAGWSNKRDLTDYGEVKKITTTLSKSNKIKVGDLLHSERAGGHIGIIVGIDKNNYYVAQALWYGQIGVVITKINKSKLKNHFLHVVLMDKYYKNDGNLTNMW